jgi:DNA modification methylase
MTTNGRDVLPDGVYLGDTPVLMREIESDSVALSVWSPPYFVGKAYEEGATFDSWQRLLEETIRAHFRVLVPGGFMVINMADILCFPDPEMPKIQSVNTAKLRCEVTRDDVLKAKAENPNHSRKKIAALLKCSEQTVDRRLNGNNIRGGKYKTQTRVMLTGHHLERYAYGSGLYLYDRRVWVKDPTWANSQWHSSSYRAVSEYEDLYVFWKPGETVVDRSRLTKMEWSEWGSRAVWNIRSVRANKDHEAQFPLELPIRLIRLLSAPSDLILDPFMGSGTTGAAAVQLGRRYIGFDKDADYVAMARAYIRRQTIKVDMKDLGAKP